jgi:capsule polysaccharide export protein KpsC/LpsZ
MEGVELVPLAYTSFDFIDQAVAVATVTGTAGWESVLRGVPSIVFGNAWYKECHGVFNGRLEADCRSAMTAIASGFKPDQKKVRQYIKTITQVGVWADRDNDYVLTDLDAETNKNVLIDHFLRNFSDLFDSEKLVRMHYPMSDPTGAEKFDVSERFA